MAFPLLRCPHTQSIQFSFTVPFRQPTELRVVVGPNEFPEKAGSLLLFPQQPTSAFVDFPLCNATINAPNDFGYAATYGWIQTVREASLGNEGLADAEWEMDPIPITADLNTPFVWFGPEPRLFDAPFRVNRTDMDWTCWSFLTYIEDSLISKVVRPILAFEWGFMVEDGKVSIKVLKRIDIDEAWEQQLAMLEKNFHGWKFLAPKCSVRVEQLA